MHRSIGLQLECRECIKGLANLHRRSVAPGGGKFSCCNYSSTETRPGCIGKPMLLLQDKKKHIAWFQLVSLFPTTCIEVWMVATLKPHKKQYKNNNRFKWYVCARAILAISLYTPSPPGLAATHPWCEGCIICIFVKWKLITTASINAGKEA